MADSSRTEQPTQQRLRKAREDGRFVSSRSFTGAVQFVVFVAVLSALGAPLLSSLRSLMRMSLSGAFHRELTPALVPERFIHLLTSFGGDWLLLGLATVSATAVAQIGATRFGLAPKQLLPNFARLAPTARLAAMPRENLASAARAVVLIPVLTVLVAATAVSLLPVFLNLPSLPVPSAATVVAQTIGAVMWRCALVLVLFGCIDLYRQHRRYMSDLRMTPEEVRQEHKENEGNPHTKARLRRLQRDLLRRNMMREIPKATAVVVNPTHYAVAIRYEHETMAAPVVLAKGRNYLALRIKLRAENSGVPIVENPPLARALYKHTDVGQEIPAHLYRAVAEVLAYVVRLAQGGGRSEQ